MSDLRIRVERVYDAAWRPDGSRVLVDRLWPRGIPKEGLRLQFWAKELAPSDDLHSWFDHGTARHDPARWAEFKRRYAEELDARAGAVAALRAWLDYGPVTLLHAARDKQHNHAVALKEYLEGSVSGSGS